MRILVLFPVFLAGLLIVPSPAVQTAEAKRERPALVVLVVFDQFCGDYLSRWGDLFGEGGFKRLTRDGAWFQNCHYPYSGTLTAAGHATMSTGCVPARHGIVGNDWYQPGKGKVYCVGSFRHQQVPPAKIKEGDKIPDSASPESLLSPTFADALKEATAGKAKVVALSYKDRSSVLPAGRRPDACYWIDKYGRLVTSTYYRDQVHPWVKDFNSSGFIDRWNGKDWDRLRPDVDYVKRAGRDDMPGEGKGAYQGMTFPHPFGPGPKKSATNYYEALANSPLGNEVLLEAARRAIDAEKLGQRGTTDFLSVSFSSNDLVGHTWGPDSQEVLDTTLRSDLIVRDLLRHLDAKVGKGKYVVVLTADHGVCPLPEVSRARGINARRIHSGKLLDLAEDELQARFPPAAGETGKAFWIEASYSSMLYLNRKLAPRRGVRLADVERVLAAFLVKQRGIQAAYTRTQLLDKDFLAASAQGRQVRASFHPDRSGDVCIVVEPYCLLTTYLDGTTHGTPHSYDTNVPLLVFGNGVKSDLRRDLVSPEHAAVILSAAAGVKPPAHARVVVPKELFVDEK